MDESAGVSAALGELWRASNPMVLRYLRGRGAVSADDLASQVWIEVARSTARFDGGANGFRRGLRRLAELLAEGDGTPAAAPAMEQVS